MNPNSIRFRLTAWYGFVLAAGFALFGVLVWVALGHQLRADLDSELEGRASRFEAYFKEEAALESGAHLKTELEEFSRAFGEDALTELRGSRGFLFRYPPPTADSKAVDVQSLSRRFSFMGEDYELRLEAPSGDVDRTLDVLRKLLLALAPLVILIAVAGGAWLSGRALRPVVALTEAANAISIENLSERLPVTATGDELALLASTLNRMLARIEGAVTTLSQFVADASHELRTPLAVMQTTVELALRRPREAVEYRKALAETGEEVARMTNLVEDLLTLARSDTGAVDMPKSAVDLVSVLRDVIQEAGPLAVHRDVRIALLPDDAAPPTLTIIANRAAVHRLFLVLIDNALKFSKPGGVVEVRLEQQPDGGGVAVAVKDYGSGIAPEHLPHLFERFFRADAARTATGGHGLGLALAHSIAREHGARILVSSTLDEGSEFRVEFATRPAAVAAAVAPTPTNASVA